MATGTLLLFLGQIDDPLDPWQRLRQRFAARSPAGWGRRLFRCRLILWRFAVGAGFDLVEQPHLQPLGVAELFIAAPVQLVLVPGQLFFVEFQLLVQFLEFAVQVTGPGLELTVLRGQLVLFQDQSTILQAQSITFLGDRRCT